MRMDFLSPFGWLTLISHEGRLIYCNWRHPECEKKLLRIYSHLKDTQSYEDENILTETCRQLEEYFCGHRKDFDIPYQLIGTEFQKRIWEKLKLIGYGETVSYKELSKMAVQDNAVRAVAHACGANPLAIILPCHRVIASNGSLGGYTGGIDKKISLLNLEKRVII